MAVSVLGVAVALAVGIVVFANLLNRSLVAHLGTSTDAAAEVAADALDEGGLARVQAQDFSELLRVQVVTASGQVVFSGFPATSAMSALRLRSGTRSRREPSTGGCRSEIRFRGLSPPGGFDMAVRIMWSW